MSTVSRSSTWHARGRGGGPRHIAAIVVANPGVHELLGTLGAESSPDRLRGLPLNLLPDSPLKSHREPGERISSRNEEDVRSQLEGVVEDKRRSAGSKDAARRLMRSFQQAVNRL
jgi:hypothetical protein